MRYLICWNISDSKGHFYTIGYALQEVRRRSTWSADQTTRQKLKNLSRIGSSGITRLRLTTQPMSITLQSCCADFHTQKRLAETPWTSKLNTKYSTTAQSKACSKRLRALEIANYSHFLAKRRRLIFCAMVVSTASSILKHRARNWRCTYPHDVNWDSSTCIE